MANAFRDQSCEIITLRVVATVEVDTTEAAKLAQGAAVRTPARCGALRQAARCSTRQGAETDTLPARTLLADDHISGPA